MSYGYSIDGGESFKGRYRSRDAAGKAGLSAARELGYGSDAWVKTARRCTREEAKEFPPPEEYDFKYWMTDVQDYEHK